MTTPTPYADGALAVLAAGFSPLPVRAGAKNPQVAGFHGYSAPMLTEPQTRGLMEKHGDVNVAARYPDGVVGIDVDAVGVHKDGSPRTGAETLAALESELGALPATYRITSVPDHATHGTALFRVPRGSRFTNRAGADIDVISHVIRYSLVAPSIHPSGRPYVHLDPAGAVVDRMPTPEELPRLPEAWLRRLLKSTLTDENPEWLEGLPDGEPTGQLARALRDFLGMAEAAEATGSAPSHTDMLTWTRALADARAYGDIGVPTASARAEAAWVSANGDESEYRRALLNAHSYTADPGSLTRPSVALRAWRRAAGGAGADVAGPSADADGNAVLDKLLGTRGGVEFNRLNDYGRGEFFLRWYREFGQQLMHVPGLGWHRWTGVLWELQTHGQMIGLSAAISKAMAARFNEYDDANPLDSVPPKMGTEERAEFEAEKRRRAGLVETRHLFANNAAVTAALAAVEGVESHDVSELNQRPHLLAARNGVINLRTGQLMKADPAWLMTMGVDTDYDPKTDTSEWDAILADILVTEDKEADPELVDYFTRLIGYGATGETREHILPILYGMGSNGKGTIMEAIASTFGPLAKTVPFTALMERNNGTGPNPEIAKLHSARFAMTSEGKMNAQMDASMIKSLTGGDTISASFKYKDSFEFAPQFLILLATNYPPKWKEQDTGTWRRIRLIPFHQQFLKGGPKTDLSVQGRVRSEEFRPVILAWAVRGAVAYYANGLAEPGSITNATSEYRKSEDILRDFITEVLIEDTSGRMSTQQMWDAYLDWCESTRNTSAFTNRNTFRAAMVERVRLTKRGKNLEFRGYRLPTAVELTAASKDRYLAAVR